MERFLKRLTISRKLMLISLSFLLPVLTLFYFVWQGIQGQIVFAEAERNGIAYHRPLTGLLQHLLTAQLAAARNQPVEAAAARIEQAWGGVATVDGQLGAALQFTAEGLSSRGRAGADVATLRSKLVHLEGWNWQAGRARAGLAGSDHRRAHHDHAARRHVEPDS